jgi:hypothetical protein
MVTMAGASPLAQADVFARSYNNVTNFVIGATAGVTFGDTVDNSSSTACLPNGSCVSNGGAGIPDTLPSQINWPAYVNNSYATNEGAPTSYIVADASIDSHQIFGAPYTQARNFTEGQLLGNMAANSTAGNSSASAFSTSFVVGTPGTTLNFRFDADPYLKAYLTANALGGSQAEGSLSLNFNIIDSNGRQVFNWVPDGVAGGLIGGTENADAFSLNTSLTALTGNPGPLLYNPQSCAIGSLATGCFNATTDALAPGVYSLNLSMRENVNLQSASAVPEPASAVLLLAGLGLAGTMARRRRR